MKTIRTLALMAFIISTNSSWGSMLELWNTKKLATESDSVAVGEVTSKWSSWDAETKMIYTYVKIKVSETVKGKAQEEILIKLAGGEIGSIGMRVHGMAVFNQGERALVFLKKHGEDYPSVVGMAQGKFHITKDPASGEDRAQYIAPTDVEFYARKQAANQQGLQQHVDPPANKDIALKQLIQEIKEAK